MASEVVVSAAIPAVNGTVPKGVGPSKKVTLPVGVDTGEPTVAVSVTGFWTIIVLTLEVNETVGVALVTVSVPPPLEAKT
jgi:hypothetical protein